MCIDICIYTYTSKGLQKGYNILISYFRTFFQALLLLLFLPCPTWEPPQYPKSITKMVKSILSVGPRLLVLPALFEKERERGKESEKERKKVRKRERDSTTDRFCFVLCMHIIYSPNWVKFESALCHSNIQHTTANKYRKFIHNY